MNNLVTVVRAALRLVVCVACRPQNTGKPEQRRISAPCTAWVQDVPLVAAKIMLSLTAL